MSTTNMIKMEFGEFINRVRDKFQLRHRFKCTVRDDGDLITLGDQDDLDLALSTCTAEAIREGSDMAKMEVSSFPFFLSFSFTCFLRSASEKIN